MIKKYDVFEQYKQVTTADLEYGRYGRVPKVSEVMAARKVRNVIRCILAGLGLAGLYALFVFVPSFFWTMLPILGVIAGVVAVVYGVVVMISAGLAAADTLRSARNHGVMED